MHTTYKIKLGFLRPVLATNPCDPFVLDTHIIDKQRKLIMDKSKLNKEINKYVDQLGIDQKRSDEETKKIFERLEGMTGIKISSDERKEILAGDLGKLKETLSSFDHKGTTIFYWDQEKDLPCISDHMIYGFMKASAEAISRTLPKKNGTVMNSCSYTQSIINQHVRCKERFISFSEDIARDENGAPEFLQRSLRAMTAQGPRVSLAKSEQVPEGSSIEFNLIVRKGSPLKEEHIKEIFENGAFCGIGQWRNAGYGMFEVVEFQRV